TASMQEFFKAFPKAYEPKEVEEKWYRFWEEGGYFKASAGSKKEPYAIVIPPPNVTGVLHMGHALVTTLQDILIRWKRMCGFETVWVPGTDHAGIATQTVVERHLMKTLGKRRSDFTREEFLGHVWKWKEESETQILNQIRKVGCSCDWSRLSFTMDQPRSRAVRTMFKKMFDAGLIYRGDYLVNWDPVTQTALADDEIEYEERESALYYIRYPIVGTDQHLTVATVRPETLLGDTAVAVSPQDLRYQSLIGKQITIPVVNRQVPIIGDTSIDPEFGTGVVKITPAHDPNDYEMAQRHNLPMINIMTPDGCINENGAEFQGLPMEEARKAVVEKLKSLGLLEKVEKYTNRVGLSYRSKAVIEPYLSKQWFVKLSHFKNKLIDLVQSKKVKLIPDSFESTYFHWIYHLRDWCISRQIWWGHRIPIWYNTEDPSQMVCYAEEGIPPEVAQNPTLWEQDTDVLDTWFSSALWPFAVFGWPEKPPDLEKFYPTSCLVTGHDILFFWVARMIVMGDYAFDKPPFSDVFLHGLIFDSRWEKMSKSKGNIIDPLEIIASYGTDAMRMALSSATTHARQIDLDRRRFEEFKNFANKIWNGARFVFMNLEGLEVKDGIDMDILKLEDRWILSKLNRIIQEVNASLYEYAFDKATKAAYDFFWKEFCAYYVEMVKPVLFGKLGTAEEKSNKQKILLVVLCNAVRLLHPMAPFITEELFQLLKPFAGGFPQDPYTKETVEALQAPACIVAPYPKVIRELDIDSAIEDEFAAVDGLVHAVRNIRAEMQIPPGVTTALYIVGSEKQLQFVQKHETILKALVRLETLQLMTTEKPLTFASTAVVGDLKLIIPLPLEMRERERTRLTKERDKLIEQQNTTRIQLGNRDFLAKAPPLLIDKLKTNLDQAEKELYLIGQKLEN
ncbi:hypothetical protein SAMD00019534_099840, partial [Acytostelium subglobosum LB1]|uniref:hypothetical protein n=1 Tax=Acytostelium subglobosum LB1 TaxID=1410327 RepID=UPI000644E67E